MTAVDLTVNVALPTIGRKLNFPESGLQWVVTAYALTFGGFLLLGGRAADLLGRRRLFMAGLATFTAASLACALADSDTYLIIMRGIQGLGAAVVLQAALSIVMNMFSEGAERNKALGAWGGIGAAGATIGLLAGGTLTRYAAQVPAHGHFWANLAGPFFLTGAVTWAFIPVSIGALAGVTQRDAGIASGLIDTSQQLGGAIGIAVASTVAAAHSRVLLGQGHAVSVALTSGFQWAFRVSGLVALVAVPVTFLLIRRREIVGAVAAALPREDPVSAPAD
jgi:MFS family permease